LATSIEEDLMFVSPRAAQRIEDVEVETTRVVAEAAIASGTAPGAFVRSIGGGVAVYVRPESPMNKCIGIGLDAPPDETSLAEVEDVLAARGQPVRVELTTLAVAEAGAILTARHYRLLGFENVLARPRSTVPIDRPPGVRVEKATTDGVAAWRAAMIDAAACPDDTGAVVDHFSRDVIVAVVGDFLQVHDHERFVAFFDGSLAGVASMFVRDGVALLGGSATLPRFRRRGVQSALIAARLARAYAQGADLAVVTTAPGSQSQANLMKHGFALAYARAILVREASRR
jgi:GNAT superfamily N-acetyltransferase